MEGDFEHQLLCLPKGLWEGLQIEQTCLKWLFFGWETLGFLPPLYFRLSLCIMIILAGIERFGTVALDAYGLLGIARKTVLCI